LKHRHRQPLIIFFPHAGFAATPKKKKKELVPLHNRKKQQQ
jgi:hypothetical protein